MLKTLDQHLIRSCSIKIPGLQGLDVIGYHTTFKLSIVSETRAKFSVFQFFAEV